MTKAELIDAIANEAGVSKADAKKEIGRASCRERV